MGLYINWMDGKARQGKPKKTIIWEDIITGTIYYLSKDKARNISNRAIDYINSIEDIEELYSYMAGEETVEDEYILKFPQLPYLVEGEGQAAYRLSDHVIIRTGILYSVFKDKRLRRYGLTEGIDIFSDKTLRPAPVDGKVAEVRELIDRVLIGEEIDEEKGKSISFDLVKGGAVKVKQYFLETNKIKDIRGASGILDDLNRRLIPEYIEENYIGESTIYAGGGSVLAILPQGEGEKLSRIIEEKHEEETITGQSCAGYRRSCLLDLAGENYRKTMRELEFIIADRQMSKFDSRADIRLRDDRLPGYRKVEGQILCDHCNIRYAHFESSLEVRLCSSCLNKVLKGGRESKRGFKEDYHNYALAKGYQVDRLRGIDSLDEIGDSIAIIYGDGNNMGNIVQRISNLGQMRYFSNKTEDAIFHVVYKALASCLGNDRFEIIAIGGDDIFIIVPAEKALAIGVEIGEEFDQLFKNKSKEEYTSTMSLGIAISHSHTPIQYLFELSQQLLKNAKGKSKELDGLGTIDIMALETDGSLGVSLKFTRQEMRNEDIRLTLRPYTWEQARAIQAAISQLKEVGARSKAYSFRDISHKMGLREGELFYLYQMKRLEKREKKAMEAISYSLKSLGKAFALKENALNLSRGQINKRQVYSPWEDIVELWDYS